ncbi:putative retrotransposon hot spot protein 4 (RHS4) [Trypanosoma vivax]|uniref:Retrotransposon hot spot (RHS) protein, putative n=1 Tax=Trypanosoma vivax (strain Y486) TaxID=1055687 RepID=F9WKB3_TRYVY|nr:putative retrotransposon hot spot protein 4 (RHS4) [Trypanosoma vivax]CCD17933.1 retrotransposon hot spot (RHS) protein, putative [Trypanosoma vivax Y486]|eukprot:CCD17933.1 retrotransposon hot spot (RHS) protein, putative [Trypanosoma vivax Y486]
MFSVFRHSLRFAGVRHARVSAHVWTSQLRLYHRTLPFLCRASSGSTTWTLNSDVADVLLRGARPPDNVMLLSECLERVRHRGTDIDGDVRMDVVIQRPERFIPDADLREMILSLPECQTYALVYRAVPLLRRHRITGLLQWGGVDENADAKRTVRDELADDGLWNTVCGLLDIAFNAAKDAEMRERVVMPESEAGKMIPGAFESVVSARWSHVLSGQEGSPLGMRVVDGLPENVWSYDEVNYNPSPRDVGKQAPRNGKLEIMVLSSEDGWPYTQFRNETANVDNNAEVGRGGVFNAQKSEDVYIRREVVRVWYIVEEKMRAWYIERRLVKPRSCIVIGTPGIGKSFACGSFLLHQLLHYEGGLLDVVAYFVRDSAYVIHNARPGVPGRVLYSDQRAAVSKIKKMASCKRGFVIVDISEKGEVPSKELPTKFWPTVVLTSPDVSHYEMWMKDRNGKLIYVNCDDKRDLEAFVAWRVLRGLPEGFENNAGMLLNAEKKLKEQLKVLDERIETVGPLPRFVLDADSYESRHNQIDKAINAITLNNKAPYMDILRMGSEWQSDHVSHKLIKLVRVPGSLSDETYRCVPLSSDIREKVHRRMLQIVKENWVLLGGLVSADCRSAVLLELLAFDAFCYSDVTEVVVDKLVYLQRDGEERKKSALAKFNKKQLHLQSSECLGTAENSFVKKCEYYVLYKPSVDNFPVADGFFFVEGHGTSGERVAENTEHSCDAHQPKTIVLLQATKARSHHTETGKLLKLKAILRREFQDWDDFSKNMRWEIVYVQHPDAQLFERRQRCDRTEVKKKKGETDEVYVGRQAAHDAEQVFWETEVDQYAVKLFDDLLAALILCLNAK